LWGDYGAILIAGIGNGRENGTYRLQRTGPFIPPITFPGWSIVVTESFRKQLEEAGLTGLSFHPVIKSLIVEYHWEKWDRRAEDPEEIPGPDGEPEDYILGHPHSPKTAQEMGVLWEPRLQRLVTAELVNHRGVADGDIWLQGPLSAVDEVDFFLPELFEWMMVSSRAKNWLETHVKEWVRFEEVLIEGVH
jgi:hypothetical protein